MAIDWEDVKSHVGADYEDDAVLQRLFAVAEASVLNWVGTSTVPEPVLDEATLLVAAELFDRSKAPSGNAGQFGDVVNVPNVRATRDPLYPAYRLLRPWVAPF